MDWLKTNWRPLALVGLAAAALYFLLVQFSFIASAQAADLGGNCCADLEERIAELESTTARKGNKKVTLQIYGQVNAGLTYFDIGDFNDTRVMGQGGDTQSSFVGFAGNAKISNDLSAGYVLEIDFRQLGLLDSGIGEQPDPGVRQSFLYLKSESIGGLSIGRQGTATQAFDELNTANTSVATRPLSIQPIGDYYLTGLDLPFDGTHRDAVKYISPSWAGFVLSAAWGAGGGDLGGLGGSDSDDMWDIALRYQGEFSGIKVVGGVGYRQDSDFVIDLVGITSIALPNADRDTFLVSASAMHMTSGIFISAFYADQSWDDISVDLKGFEVQAGVENKFLTPLGKTTLYGLWGQVDTGNLAGTPDYWGLGITQNLEPAALDLYLVFKQYDLGDLNEDATAVTGGARIRF